MIRVLVVEDSPVARDLLVHILKSEPGIEVIGTAENGEEAVEKAVLEKPDVITMDIHMPKMNGFEATQKIMETKPTPIVIATGSADAREVSISFRAIEAGAVSVIAKPKGIGHPQYERDVKALIQTVKLMSEVKVVRRWAYVHKGMEVPVSIPTGGISASVPEIRIAAIGASTGGPVVLQTILSRLPRDFPVPLVIVQHMAAGFISGFVEWLNQSSGCPVHIAAHNEYLLPGHAYIAPDEFQMGVSGSRLVLSNDAPVNGLKPSVSYLFRTVADVYGKTAAGILLTGMGTDGAKELKLLKQKGAVTIVQDEESSVVHGMPGEAMTMNAAGYVLPPEKIASLLISLTQKRRRYEESLGQ